MQEHVELEVSLEIVMAELANKIFKMQKDNAVENAKKIEILIKLQEKAYMGDRESIKKILNKEFYNG